MWSYHSQGLHSQEEHYHSFLNDSTQALCFLLGNLEQQEKTKPKGLSPGENFDETIPCSVFCFNGRKLFLDFTAVKGREEGGGDRNYSLSEKLLETPSIFCEAKYRPIIIPLTVSDWHIHTHTIRISLKVALKEMFPS